MEILDNTTLIQEMVAASREAECEDCGADMEDDRCTSCTFGHDDCETNECFACMERAIDRAEHWADMARDEEMGL